MTLQKIKEGTPSYNMGYRYKDTETGREFTVHPFGYAGKEEGQENFDAKSFALNGGMLIVSNAISIMKKAANSISIDGTVIPRKFDSLRITCGTKIINMEDGVLETITKPMMLSCMIDKKNNALFCKLEE